ncbi:N-acetyltransferase [Anoxybacterium hadale]|uniref:N-acetyltransferase n=1 Tax=Anoxybacterium hadale TaxID=3408580 RepID=A0ACD1A7M9_9FIRM|nr:N-acetyltransferase [Clostridiales bacterium]
MIRKVEQNETDLVMNIWLETNVKAHDFIERSYWEGNFELVKEMLPDSEVFVYEQNHIVQGFIGLMDQYIAGIFVKADGQSKGIGKALLNYVMESHSELSLHVYKKNIRAVEFYVREGFDVVKVQVDENTGEVELAMNWAK